MKQNRFRLSVAAMAAVLCIVGVYLFAFAQTKPGNLSKVFEKINYQVKNQTIEMPTDWETEQFQTLSRTIYSVKRKTALAGSQKNMFPRFEVVEEIYADEQTAEARLKRISEKPPDLPIEKREYWMVSGFRKGKIIYFISTDAIIFYEGIGDFAEQLDNEVSAVKEINRD